MKMKTLQQLTEEHRTNLAAQLGLEVEDVRALDPQWLEFMNNGVLVTVHVGRWRATQQLTYEDLGLPPMDKKAKAEASKLMRLGVKLQMPDKWRKRFESLESRGRDIPKRYGIRIHYGDFVTAHDFEKVITQLREIQAEWYGEAAMMCSAEGWEELRTILADESRASARVAYHRMQRLDPDSMAKISEEAFVENYVASNLDTLPTPGSVHSTFRFEWDLNYIPLPSLIESERAEMEAIQIQRNIARAEESEVYQKQAHEKHLRDLEADRKRKQVVAERDKLNAEVEAERLMHQEVARQAVRQKSELIDDFIRGYASKLYTLFFEATDQMIGTTRKNGTFHPRSVLQLENMIKMGESINKFGIEIPDVDLIIDSMKDTYQQVRNSTKDPHTVGDVERKLEAVRTLSEGALIAIGEHTRSNRSANFTTDVLPSAQRLKNARIALGAVVTPEIENSMPSMQRGKRKALAYENAEL